MALQLDYYDELLEVTVPNCYYKISRLVGNKYGMELYLDVFKNKENADSNVRKLVTKMYVFQPDMADDAPNIYTQGYAYLKSLDEFQNCIDV